MKTILLAVLASALLACPAVDARDWRGSRGPQLQAAQTVKKAPPKQAQRGQDKRGGHEKGHQNRLTDQERRDLRRDVDRADREIYRR